MTTLAATVTHSVAPITTQQFRIMKAIEHFYYIQLLTREPSYKHRPELWRNWLAIGFHIAVKVPPYGIPDGDAISLRVRSNGKAPEYTAVTGNASRLADLQGLIADIDALRKAISGQEDSAKIKALLASPVISKGLVAPMLDALKRSGLRAEEVESYLAMVRRGLLSLTHKQITSIQLSLS